MYDEQGRVAFDPDQQVTEALRGVFRAFRARGSGLQVAKWHQRESLLLPNRPGNGPLKGTLRWAVPSHGRVLGILKNPAYAGAYVYGKTRVERQTDGKVRRVHLARKQWRVCIPEHHEGFIDWQEYCRNQETLARNRRSFPGSRGSRGGVARNGAALLQGITLCGRCGQRMHTI